ncbi:hypothetical protein RHGRI_024801 [Rhododendron griersonianum]|uniref:F-box associated beta-propeller type 3 domain-containing protein n=1 Tax=Rhododendron griersonianum TaxID=479676 RepID=A0AAV6JDM7_9ERIC|nr:hypothetical protein RHGRI_024801 [Rhododendron griersonianum]
MNKQQLFFSFPLQQPFLLLACCDYHLHGCDDSLSNQNQAPPLLGTTCLFKRALVTFKSNAMCSKKGTLRFSSGNTCGITNEAYLPREIWLDILTRLPAKMVGQCNKEIIALPPFKPQSNSYAKMGKFRLDSVPLVSFGFDPSTKQYKVVNIYRVMKQSTCGELESSHCECEIFTLGSLSWRKIDIIPPASHFEFGADGICLGGVIHWRNFSSDNSHTVHDEVVVTFDLKDERFGVISLPRGPSCMPRLVELGGHLAACEEFPENEVEELWILEDYDNWVWVKERIMLPPDHVGPNRGFYSNKWLNSDSELEQSRYIALLIGIEQSRFNAPVWGSYCWKFVNEIGELWPSLALLWNNSKVFLWLYNG